MGKLSLCIACNSHVKSIETQCPHCGAALQVAHGRSSAILLGLALAGCPGGDDGDTTIADTTAGTATETMTGSTGSASVGDTGSSSISGTTDQSDLDSAYGTPETGESFTTGPDSSSTDGTGTGSTGTSGSTSGDDSTSVGEPEYGVPETG